MRKYLDNLGETRAPQLMPLLRRLLDVRASDQHALEGCVELLTVIFHTRGKLVGSSKEWQPAANKVALAFIAALERRRRHAGG